MKTNKTRNIPLKIVMLMVLFSTFIACSESNVTKTVQLGTNTANDIVKPSKPVSTNAAFWSWCENIIILGRSYQIKDAEEKLNTLKQYCQGKYTIPIVDTIPVGYYIHYFTGTLTDKKKLTNNKNINKKIVTPYNEYRQAYAYLSSAKTSLYVSNEMCYIQCAIANELHKAGVFGDARLWVNSAYGFCTTAEQSNYVACTNARIEYECSCYDTAFEIIHEKWRAMKYKTPKQVWLYATLLMFINEDKKAFDTILCCIEKYGISLHSCEKDYLFNLFIQYMNRATREQVRAFYDLLGAQLPTLVAVPKYQERNAKRLLTLLLEQRKLIGKAYRFSDHKNDKEIIRSASQANIRYYN